MGKLGVIAALVAAVAVLPAVAAYVLGVCFSLDLGVIRDTWRLLPASILYGLVIVVSAGTLILALSSLSRRSLYIGIAWIGLWFISSMVAVAITGVQQSILAIHMMQEEMARAGLDKKTSDPHWYGKHQQEFDQVQRRVQARLLKKHAEEAPRDWRPLCSYTANLERLGEALLHTDPAWVEFARAIDAPRKVFGSLAGAKPELEFDERFLADQKVPQYPWIWSAGVLAGLLGISLWILSSRVKSLDRLR